jgi:hypothetical protein
MKSFRITIRYNIDNEQVGLISVTVPAYNDTQAINKTIDANQLAGKVIAGSAKEVN